MAIIKIALLTEHMMFHHIRHAPLPHKVAYGISLFIFAMGALIMAEAFSIKAKAALAQLLLERAWAETQSHSSLKNPVKPWPWADISPQLELHHPRLGKKMIALSGVNGEALAFGPGVLASENSAMTQGLTVISGHRDTHFSFLKYVQLGDDVVITTAKGESFTYQIEETRIVPYDASGLSPRGAKAQIALVTCWPFTEKRQGPLRFVAIASLKETSAL
ncbi:MAG: class GN sortase [Pseudomonadota bacterium]